MLNEVKKAIDRLQPNEKELLERLKDYNLITYNHSIRTAELVCKLTKMNKLKNKEREEYIEAALLHDIGKLKIPNEIINKPGKLTAKEIEIMDIHASIKEFKLNRSKHFVEAIEQHHGKVIEKVNEKTKSKIKISPENEIAKVIQIADVFDALSHERPYKKAKSIEDSLKIITENEKHDKTYVELLNKLINKKIFLFKDKFVENLVKENIKEEKEQSDKETTMELEKQNTNKKDIENKLNKLINKTKEIEEQNIENEETIKENINHLANAFLFISDKYDIDIKNLTISENNKIIDITTNKNYAILDENLFIIKEYKEIEQNETRTNFFDEIDIAI